MSHDPIVLRQSIRLPDYDYTACGTYFVTICTHLRTRFFDEPAIRLVAERQWQGIEQRYAHVTLDEWVVMADHVHGLLVFGDMIPVAPDGVAPTTSPSNARGLGINVQTGSLGAIVRAYKAAVTRRVHRQRNRIDGPIWQRGYWERVIRNEQELAITRQYIVNNPLREAEDRDNLAALFDRLQHHE